MNHKFFAYIDNLGIETLVDLTKLDQKANLSFIKDEPVEILNLHNLFLRARLNSHRLPEMWIFSSNMSELDLQNLRNSHAEELTFLIQSTGRNIFKTADNYE